MDVSLTPALEQPLEHLAAQTNRPYDDLVREGLERFLSSREALENAVEEGRAAARRGELIDHEQAMLLMDGVVEHG